MYIKKTITISIFLLASINTVNAGRMMCICCDDSELIEFTIKSCHSTPVDTVVEGIKYRGRSDLVVVGTLTSSVPVSQGVYGMEIDYDNHKKGLSEERTFVYEGRNETTCEYFPVGSSKVMVYDKLGCVLMNEENFNDDPACYFGGHRISKLPSTIRQLIEKHQSKKQSL